MRSKLFVPASRPELFPKALASDADAVCYDLEDAVIEERKEEARAGLRVYLKSAAPVNCPLEIVRINGFRSAHFLDDLEAIVWPRLMAVVLPKVEDADEVRELEEALRKLENERHCPRPVMILPTIESPAGLRKAHDIALSSDRIAGLQAGFADLLEPLGIVSSHSFARSQVRLALRLAAGEAHLPCFDAAYANFRDLEGFAAEAELARALGFRGTSCIHPSQVVVANRVYAPTAAEIEHAVRVIAAMDAAREAGSGVPVVDGRMVDAPFERAAKLLLARALSKARQRWNE